MSVCVVVVVAESQFVVLSACFPSQTEAIYQILRHKTVPPVV
jgi:hypothetical protein